MTKNEYIASILLEAADLLQESAGKNGFKSKEISKGRPDKKSRIAGADAADRYSQRIENIVERKNEERDFDKYGYDGQFKKTLKKAREKNIDTDKINYYFDKDGGHTLDQRINYRGWKEDMRKKGYDNFHEPPAPDNTVPSKLYKRGESVNTNRLQSLINRCKKAIDVIDYDADSGKRSDVKGDLVTINKILNESRYLMNQLIKINDKPNNETINECFSDIDKLVGVVENCEYMLFSTSSSLNEGSNSKSKIDTALKVANHAWKAIVRKLKVIVSQLVALFKRISGNNKIPKDAYYIDISKAINIVDKIISGSK